MGGGTNLKKIVCRRICSGIPTNIYALRGWLLRPVVSLLFGNVICSTQLQELGGDPRALRMKPARCSHYTCILI